MPKVSKIYVGTNLVRPIRLPSEYQEVEYIQNSGTQYIDIWLNIKDGYRFVSKLNSISAQTWNGWRITWGYLWPDSWITWGHARLYFWWVASNGWSYWYLNSFSNWWFWSANTGVDYEVEFSWVSWNAFIKINWTYIWDSSTTYTTSLPWTISLMASHDQNSTYNIHPWLRVYNAEYYNNSGVLVRNLIPCYRKLDTVIWLYDIVNNVFYTNSWTWTFIKWNDVN